MNRLQNYKITCPQPPKSHPRLNVSTMQMASQKYPDNHPKRAQNQPHFFAQITPTPKPTFHATKQNTRHFSQTLIPLLPKINSMLWRERERERGYHLVCQYLRGCRFLVEYITYGSVICEQTMQLNITLLNNNPMHCGSGNFVSIMSLLCSTTLTKLVIFHLNIETEMINLQLPNNHHARLTSEQLGSPLLLSLFDNTRRLLASRGPICIWPPLAKLTPPLVYLIRPGNNDKWAKNIYKLAYSHSSLPIWKGT